VTEMTEEFPRNRQGREHSVGYASLQDRAERRQEIIKEVRRRSKGKPVEEIGLELERAFIAAGIPQVPERVSILAGWIGGSTGATLWFAGRSLRQVWTGESPDGLRLDRSLLPGGHRWTLIDLVGDASTQERLRMAVKALELVESHASARMKDRMGGLTARLIVIRPALGDEQIGVVLSHDFVGELPQESQTAGIREAIARAETSNRRLVVRARIGQPGPDASLTLEVSLP
jgi:hypothetical protein